MDADYGWLFPKGRFSYQAKMLEVQLLHSRSLKGTQEMALSPRSPKEFPDHSLMTVAKRELYRLATADVAFSPKPMVPRSKDRQLMGRLQQDLLMREREVSKSSKNLERETLDRLKLKGENGKLGRQLEQTLEKIAQLETRLHLQDNELASKEQTISQLSNFLQDTADKQTEARGALRGYVEELMVRAETAENAMETLKRSSRMPSPLPPASSSSDVLDDRTDGRISRSRDNKWQNSASSGPHNRQQTPKTDNWPSSRNHNQSWQSPMRGISDELQTSNLQPSGLHMMTKNPQDNRYGNPTLPRTNVSGPYHTPGSLRTDSGLESFGTGNRVSEDQSGVSQTHIPSSYAMGRSPLHVPFDKFQSSPSLSQLPPGMHRSRDSLAIEPVIHPAVSCSLQEERPTHQRKHSGNLGPLSDKPWDLNFLNGVMADVLKHREAESHIPVMYKPSNGTLERSVGSHHASQSEFPARGFKSPPVAHWSSSDYDEDELADEETGSESEVDQSAMRRSKQPGAINSSAFSSQHPRWRAVWLCVFNQLNTEMLLTCAQVCREWRSITKHPSLWKTVRLSNHKIASKFLQTISPWCESLEHLYLEGLKPRSKQAGEGRERYNKTTRGSLEPGLEYILLTAGTRLRTLQIVDCSNVLTERSLFLTSCYCRNLYSLTFISQTDPVGHEVIWALGAGCRSIASLKIPPRQPCEQQQRLSNHCLQMIGRCWPLLLALSVGGRNIDVHGLVSVARNCPRLQVLELDHLPEVSEAVAIAMCQAGLRGLHTLILKNTLICPAAILQFNGACPQLKSLAVYLNPSNTRGDNRDFHNVVSQLRTLAKKRVLNDVLRVIAKYN